MQCCSWHTYLLSMHTHLGMTPLDLLLSEHAQDGSASISKHSSSSFSGCSHLLTKYLAFTNTWIVLF